MMVETTKVLEEAAKERMELILQHYQEVEWSKMILDKVQTTYQTKLLEYKAQAKAVTDFIKQLKNQKEANETGIKRIRMIITTRRERTKVKIDIVRQQYGISCRGK